MDIFNFSWFLFYFKLFIICVVRRNLVRLILALIFFSKNQKIGEPNGILIKVCMLLRKKNNTDNNNSVIPRWGHFKTITAK